MGVDCFTNAPATHATGGTRNGEGSASLNAKTDLTNMKSNSNLDLLTFAYLHRVIDRTFRESALDRSDNWTTVVVVYGWSKGGSAMEYGRGLARGGVARQEVKVASRVAAAFSIMSIVQ